MKKTPTWEDKLGKLLDGFSIEGVILTEDKYDLYDFIRSVIQETEERVRGEIEQRIKNYKALRKVGINNAESEVRLSECESILDFLSHK